jgi:CMP-N-acetylneuraminic acid synthetase
MYKGKSILALIPARGGSKGLPGKNIKPLLGKPLIAYTIEQALASKYPDKVIVSTDSEEIAEISKKYGAEVPFMRPKELAEDDSPTSEVIIHLFNWFEKQGIYYDIIVLLEPTSPLRKEEDIDNAIKLFIDNMDRADSLVGVGKIHSDTEHPYGAKIIEDGFVRPFLKNVNFNQRQQLPEMYSIFGGIYISKVNTFKKTKTFYHDKTIPYFLERWQNYEVDDIYDFLAIEAIIKFKKGGAV